MQNPGKIVPAGKRVKQVGMVTSAKSGSLVTVAWAVNAIGNSIPPFIIFPRVYFKKHMIKGDPPGTCGAAHSSG